MNTDPTQDAHSLGIALRLAQAQNRDLRKQLATATEALEFCRDTLVMTSLIDKSSASDAGVNKADEALAAIKPDQGKQP